jgi:hypothetical protein
LGKVVIKPLILYGSPESGRPDGPPRIFQVRCEPRTRLSFLESASNNLKLSGDGRIRFAMIYLLSAVAGRAWARHRHRGTLRRGW